MTGRSRPAASLGRRLLHERAVVVRRTDERVPGDDRDAPVGGVADVGESAARHAVAEEAAARYDNGERRSAHRAAHPVEGDVHLTHVPGPSRRV
jgi:hypothetical protein